MPLRPGLPRSCFADSASLAPGRACSAALPDSSLGWVRPRQCKRRSAPGPSPLTAYNMHSIPYASGRPRLISPQAAINSTCLSHLVRRPNWRHSTERTGASRQRCSLGLVSHSIFRTRNGESSSATRGGARIGRPDLKSEPAALSQALTICPSCE
jgi:hypothetical protein